MQALLKETWTEYWYNFKTGLAFLLLLVFVVPFLYLHGFYFSSGSVFGDYDFAKLTPGEFLISAAVLLAYLFAYSVFLTLTIFAIRKRYSTVKVHYFLSEQIHKFALKVFGFLVAVLAAAWFLGWLWLSLGLPMAWLQLLWLLVLSALMFVPQAIVIDEQDVYTSVQMAWHFCLRHKRAWLMAWLTGFVLLAVLVGLEFLVDYHFYAGKYAALVASLVFVVPFYEAMKSVLYMQKFDMVRRAYRHHSTKKHGRASSS